MKKKQYVPERGDIVRVNLDPTRGHEQANIRPALVLSPALYNAKAKLMLACPITSRAKGYPFEVSLPETSGTRGVVLSDQVRVLDWTVRGVRLLGRIDESALADVQARVVALVQG